jgi:hypothetical protein
MHRPRSPAVALTGQVSNSLLQTDLTTAVASDPR